MLDKIMRQLFDDAIENEVLGKTITAVEVHLPNTVIVTLDNGLSVSLRLNTVVTLPDHFTDQPC